MIVNQAKEKNMPNQVDQTRYRPVCWLIGLLLFVSYQGSGCGFIESAGELTFGEGQIPLLETEFQYPSVNQISGLDQTEEVIPGFPSSLDNSTLAHLVGALSAQGECGQNVDLTDGLDQSDSNLIAASFELSACAEDDRCKAQCPEGFYGLNAAVRIKMKALTKEQTQEITNLLSEDSASAIVQIRLNFKKLSFFQGKGDQYEETNQWIEGFELNIGTDDQKLKFLDQKDFEKITQSTSNDQFERYALPRQHPVTLKLIEQLLSGGDFILDIEQRFRLPREALYLMHLSPAGISQIIQPEVVISAIEVATSTL
jgi:hypothetical protein